jgi:hypothetical protein
MKTLAEFIADCNLSVEVSSVPENPHMVRADEEKPWEADHWFFTLKTARRQMSGYYSKGAGHRKYSRAVALRVYGYYGAGSPFRDGDSYPMRPTIFEAEFRRAFIAAPPTVQEVVACLMSDAQSVHYAATFEDWAAEFGYDTDSRTAHKTYKIVMRQTQKLRAMLGNAWFTELMENVEPE